MGCIGPELGSKNFFERKDIMDIPIETLRQIITDESTEFHPGFSPSLANDMLALLDNIEKIELETSGTFPQIMIHSNQSLTEYDVNLLGVLCMKNLVLQDYVPDIESMMQEAQSLLGNLLGELRTSHGAVLACGFPNRDISMANDIGLLQILDYVSAQAGFSGYPLINVDDLYQSLIEMDTIKAEINFKKSFETIGKPVNVSLLRKNNATMIVCKPAGFRLPRNNRTRNFSRT